MASRVSRRLPGIRFEAPPSGLDEVLPRMDIAVFVGFASSGPVHLPVAVESAVEYEAVFGADAPLAWDQGAGGLLHAQLGPAVRAFFQNGGIRCWVIRVAATPSTNFLPIPGVVRWSRAGAIAPAFARATSPGSWSDDITVAAAEEAEPLEAFAFAARGDRFWIDVAAVDEPRSGDLLRVTTGSAHVVMLAVDEVAETEWSPPAPQRLMRVGGRGLWFRPLAPSSPPAALTGAVVYTARREPSGRDETFALASTPILDWNESFDGGKPIVRIDLRLPLEEIPAAGAMLSVDVGPEQLWLAVIDTGIVSQDEAGTARVSVRGQGLWWVKSPAAARSAAVRCERVRLDLWVRQGSSRQMRLSALDLVPGGARYWSGLPDDSSRFGRGPEIDARLAALVDEARGFSLAGAGPLDAIYLPIATAIVPGPYLGAARQPRKALERDGLATFDAPLFLDRDLVAPLTERLLNAAEHLRFRHNNGRHLTGIHGALEIDEATIIAVPDAAHRGWTQVQDEDPPLPRVDEPEPPPAQTFIPCALHAIDPPRWQGAFASATLARMTSGTFTLLWTGGSNQAFELVEARSPDFDDARPIYAGNQSQLTIYGHTPGAYYYRVRATAGASTSEWSSPIVVSVAGARSWHVRDEDDFASDTLVTVHRALLRLSAARGDMLAVLALPAHFREDGARAYAAALKRSLDAGEARGFSFGALYHPWVALRETAGAAPVTRVSPDGPAAGVIAQRALRRGAWIAPANEPIRGALATTPFIALERRSELLESAINVIGQEPRGFVALSANTLSDDPDFAPINVRRLLSLLRRLALREGATYVFEPLGESFRRLVQRGFERMLTGMFERGAFAGATAATSFQVNTSDSLNTPRTLDAGQFVVELRVAPSLPMTFLTVRLVQSGDRALVMEER